MQTWTAPTILSELCDDARRLSVLETFWKKAPPQTRKPALQLLARAMRFREVTLKKAPAAQKANWAIRRLRHPDLRELFREAILAWHMESARGLMGSCLDAWGIPHAEGVVEAEEYELPTPEAVAASLPDLRSEHADEDLAFYFAAAGLVMGEEREEWRECLWPLIDTLRGEKAEAEAEAEA